jgi:hypothetical protein
MQMAAMSLYGDELRAADGNNDKLKQHNYTSWNLT